MTIIKHILYKLPKPSSWLGFIAVSAAAMAVAACSSTKFIPEGQTLLKDVKIVSDNKRFDCNTLTPYLGQRPNSKWFSLFKVPLGIYNLSGRDSTKWGNRFVRRLGEGPVIYDSLAAVKTCQDMTSAMRQMGYMQAATNWKSNTRHKKTSLRFTAIPGPLYTIDSVKYEIDDPNIERILGLERPANRGLKRGMTFSIDNLEAERKRITAALLDSGYYRFNKDFMNFRADSTENPHKVNVVLHLMKYKASNNSPAEYHKCYTLNNINYIGGDDNNVHLRHSVLLNNTEMQAGKPFSASDLQHTYNNFARLQAVRYTNIKFKEHPDSALLDCDIQVSTNKPNTISFQPEGTNTAGDLGAAASLTYENRNLFRGSELLSIQLRAAFEAITGLEGYQNQDYEEYNIEAKLTFPRTLAPFLSRSFRRKSNTQSELSLSYNLQNRPEFHRRVFSSTWRYRWESSKHRSQYRLDLVDVNYVRMPWISATFKKDYLDDASNRNAILRYNYEDLFILRTGFNVNYNNAKYAIRANVETGGNLLNLFSRALGSKRNANGQYTLFNIAYAQYVKADFDYTRLFTFDTRNTLSWHFGFGLACPYGNSNVLPFEKRYFSGGANSVRGWSVRGLGPGSFKGSDGRIDFINQTGDMKLDLNLEWRTFLFWKFNGAFFIDAGNIWTLKDYPEQPGGQFKFNEFYKQIAAAYGLGLRLNLDYFVLRLDFGMKAVNPAYTNSQEHYPIVHPDFGRDLAVHFAVGLPF